MLRDLITEPHCLILIRHGESGWNTADRLTTTTDVQLTEHGKQQAAAVAQQLTGVDFDYVSSSPLTRALTTAEIACQQLDVDITVDDKLIEPAAGLFEGKTFTELRDNTTSIGKQYADYQDELNPVFPDSTEKLVDTVARAADVFNFAADNPGRHLLFSHGAFIRILTQYGIGGNPACYRRLKLGNCRAVVFKFFPQPPHQLIGFNV